MYISNQRTDKPKANPNDPLNREKLSQVRVMQKNLVFVVGLSTHLADDKILRKPEYFGTLNLNISD
jgi:hypothetical protein